MTESERLKELLLKCDPIQDRDLNDDWGDGEIDDIVDHLLANGVIVPPCKVGDTVYETQPIRKRVQAYEITTVKWNGHYFWLTWVLKDGDGIYGNVDGFASHKIGKTVFLTREEAEKALEGMQ